MSKNFKVSRLNKKKEDKNKNKKDWKVVSDIVHLKLAFNKVSGHLWLHSTIWLYNYYIRVCIVVVIYLSSWLLLLWFISLLSFLFREKKIHIGNQGPSQFLFANKIGNLFLGDSQLWSALTWEYLEIHQNAYGFLVSENLRCSELYQKLLLISKIWLDPCELKHLIESFYNSEWKLRLVSWDTIRFLNQTVSSVSRWLKNIQLWTSFRGVLKHQNVSNPANS